MVTRRSMDARPYDQWEAAGELDMEARLARRVDELLERQPEPLDPRLDAEIERIVAAAHRELVDGAP